MNDYTMTYLLISVENEILKSGTAIECISIMDDHSWHIKEHLNLALYPRSWFVLVKHIYRHLVLWREYRKTRLPKVYIEDFIKHE